MNSERFHQAINAFDAYHARDPVSEEANGRAWPREQLYAHRMVARLESYAPEADEVLQLAARCQHIGRWEIPRDRYPLDRKGYLQWRNAEKIHHASIAGEILSECGYDTTTIAEVRKLVLKKELATDPRAQIIEDIACLVFIEHYLDDFAARHTDEKVLDILRKTMRKMTDRAKSLANELAPEGRIKSLINRAAR